jgi:hypothetical protein
LFYRPSTTGSDAKGWQSDDPAESLMGITQTNLSTETNPPRTEVLKAAVAVKPDVNLIGTPNDFLRLLWEASITRQGGFYLSYSTGIPKDVRGLPDHAFNDRGEAEVAVFALFTSGANASQKISNYMNVVVTNEPFDLSDAALMATAVLDPPVQGVSFKATDTLASYADLYYSRPAVLAEDNPSVTFNDVDGLQVTVTGGVYEVPPKPQDGSPGGNLNRIAEYFSVDAVKAITADDIKKANAAGSRLPDQLDSYTAIKLPPIKLYAKGKSFNHCRIITTFPFRQSRPPTVMSRDCSRQRPS